MSYVLNNIYYPDDPDIEKLRTEVTSTYKLADHAQQRKDHARDLVQPHLPDGSINPQFIEAFPIESKERGYLG